MADIVILRATFNGLKKRLAAELGVAFKTLKTLMEHYPFGKTKRERKGTSTKIIADTFHISTRQASTRKRQLAEAAEVSGVGVIRELVGAVLS